MFSLFAQSWRTWKHAPSVAVLAILALAIGVTATTAIYTFVQGVLLKPLPYANPDRYLRLVSRYGGTSFVESSWAYPECLDVSQRNRTLAVVGCLGYGGKNLTMDRRTAFAQGNQVTPALMRSLGVPLERGSWFGADPSDLHTAVISDHLWREFGAPADIVGKHISINTVPYVVKGVAKPWFRFPVQHSGDIWYPIDASPAYYKARDGHFLDSFAKMKPGVAVGEAAADVRRIMAQLEREYPDTEQGHTAIAVSMLQSATEQVRPTFFLLLGAAAALLLIACGNVASLLLARAVARSRETAVRVAVGASSLQLAAQYISEGLLIALIGAGLGLLGSVLLVRLVLHLAVAEIPRAEDIHIDANVLFAAIGSVVLCGVLFSLAPLWQALRTSPNAVLTNGQRATASAPAQRLLSTFVTVQLALSCALLTIALLCVQHFGSLSHKDPGFDPNNVTTFNTYIPLTPFKNGTARAEYQTRLLESMERAHLATSVGFTSLLPFSHDSGDTIIVPDNRDVSHYSPSQVLNLLDYQFRTVSPSFFTSLRIPLVAGRYLTSADANDKNPGVVVDEEVVRRLWPHGDAVGHTVTFGGDSKKQPVRVVGVVADVIDKPDKPATGHVYLPYQLTDNILFPDEWALRTGLGAKVSLAAVEHAVHAVDPQLAVYDFGTMDKRRQEYLGQNKLQSDVVALFGVAALTLSVLGVFGVVTYTVRQRIPEMGTRLALGATGNELLYLVIKQGVLKAAIGGLAGIIVVLASIPLLAKLDVAADHAWPFLASLVLVLLSTAVAAAFPAWRASLLSPMIALRDAPDSFWRRTRQQYARAAHSVSSLVPHQGSRTNSTEAALLAEIAESTRQADSFTTAIRTALFILTERIPARAAALLVRRTPEEPFRCLSAVPDTNGNWSLPFDSILLSRLAHFYPALPFTEEDLEVLNRWAEETQSGHREEIAVLRSLGSFVAVPVSVKSGISGILFVTPPSEASAYNSETLRLLRSVASQLALMIENSQLADRIVEQERLRRELALASEVQKRLFPERPPDVRSAKLVGYCLPARGVGGDYYDFLRTGSDQLSVALADVAGKGIAAALVMSVIQASVRSLADEASLPLPDVTGKINRLLCASTGPSSYATFFYARFDENTRCLSYVNGGHNPPFVLRNHDSHKIEELKTGGMIIGMFPFSTYEEGRVQLEPGDVLMLFTDGVSEAHNPEEEEFGEMRLKELLQKYGHLAVEEMSTAILNELRAWMSDAPQHDDLTFVLMKVQ